MKLKIPAVTAFGNKILPKVIGNLSNSLIPCCAEGRVNKLHNRAYRISIPYLTACQMNFYQRPVSYRSKMLIGLCRKHGISKLPVVMGSRT